MDAGSLNRRVQIMQRSTAVDSIGQTVETWTPLASVWAWVKHLSGVETLKAGSEHSTTKTSIRVRYRTDVTPAMRVLYGSVVYDIDAVLHDLENKVYLDLLCTKVD